MISSTQQRFLEQFPQSEDGYNSEVIQILLELLLQPSINITFGDTENTPRQNNREISMHMLWIWQTPMMLISWSWMFFLLGLLLHILTPVIRRNEWTMDCTVSLAHCYRVGVLILTDFNFDGGFWVAGAPELLCVLWDCKLEISTGLKGDEESIAR